MLILGIETSCDETAAAVVADGTRVLSNVIATQHNLHELYAGVVPEIASRAHIERITPVIREALNHAGLNYSDLDAIAVGHRPGLIGSLLVGVSAAKALAWSLEKPIIGVDHVLAHLHAGLLDSPPVEYPALGLVVSGGHTSLFLVRAPLDVQLLGKTIDDAVGEAYDKAATILQLGYPGGPLLDALAQTGNDRAHDFPVTLLSPESLDFSFSGLKTALLYAVCGQPVGRGMEARLQRDASHLSQQEKADFAASFQRAAVSALIQKLTRALKKVPGIFSGSAVRSLLVGGGVSANSLLRTQLKVFTQKHHLELRLPQMQYCLDNAAMIAGAAAARFRANQFDTLTLSASPQTALT
ncbi:MAG: tRNA (adenosine(37)-N6)-threonylcarbamoyltransferase complex transferase subunit TsaD [Phycisphaerales bacterium]|nr:tRNA (adenosine(37)-N6)-threonylcarbamoyltransferase complex transferase subunit TsaD [Phycisphaerales bacterium]